MDLGVLALISSTSDVRLDITVGAAGEDRGLGVMAVDLGRLKADARFRAISLKETIPADEIRNLEACQNFYFHPIFTPSFTETGGSSRVCRRGLQLDLFELQSRSFEVDSKNAVILNVQQRTYKDGPIQSGNTPNGSQMQ